MIELTQLNTKIQNAPDGYLSLPIDSRIKSRLKVMLDDGRNAGLFLPRGHILRGGEQLSSECGLVVEVKAAPETVSTVYCEDLLLLTRVAYHLGNRHVPLQVEAGWVRYQHDHVLDEMVEGLGAKVTTEKQPFEPEGGAYGGRSGGHHHHH
ncbi:MULTISPECIES: urease accessory protein UreE [Vibrio]|jgi:urease accessory protein|uniref:Urease accessory protein UreE n=1 Tax=Vibrio splendidus TaxID=29497 RepID=A0A2N7MBG3_VIBSP|nr:MULTISPECIES: urease accessory protein UreE [Vibrio]MBO7912844.1 urease accessory protein UreE [Vibrio sp. G41H]MCF7492343.1 urease accessory protein UreE [Vibrio sp. G-C-1]MDH5888743.1 urease accessory protein UreE [Vibrio splendidus]MDH5910058.1 urease accessory protein UreE [Vibrio splendidus]MDH5917784.1 urease accessory protein UreE [Vibrio splendidus]